MKENNYIKDKEILEETVKQFQTDLQVKSELIRSMRRDLNTQSSNLSKDLEMKNNELEKVMLENADLKKQTVILQETIDHHVQRIETLKSEMEKQQKLFDRELDCKSKLIGFHESSSQQKESKINSINEDNKKLLSEILELKHEVTNLKSINEEMNRNHETNFQAWREEIDEKDEELNKLRSDISQMQQKGISEVQLEKMNPIAAATLKVLKSSRGLMEIYSELHSRISQIDQLQLERDRLQRHCDQLDGSLTHSATTIDRLTGENRASSKLTDELKSRLLGLVSELRASDSRRADTERQLALAHRDLATNSREIERLNQQVRRCLIVAQAAQSAQIAAGQPVSPQTEQDLLDIKETVVDVKQEEVDADSTLYSTVHELQAVNDALRLDNERYRTRIELRDDERWEHRCHELETRLGARDAELEQARREASASRSQLMLHEKQLGLMRYMLELRTGDEDQTDHELVDGTVRQLEAGDEERKSAEAPGTSADKSRADSGFEEAIGEMMDHKRASDQVYATSIEHMRVQIAEGARKIAELQHQLEHNLELLKDERDLNEQSSRECTLLRKMNRNLQGGSAQLEGHIDELKRKLETKIRALAERQADLAVCQSQLETNKAALERLRIERDDQSRSYALEEQLTNNLASLQGGALLADRLFRAGTRSQIEALQTELVARDTLIRTLEEQQSIPAQPSEAQFVGCAQASQTEPVETAGSDAICQTESPEINENEEEDRDLVQSEHEEHQHTADAEIAALCQQQAAQIEELQAKILEDSATHQDALALLQADIDQATRDIKDWTRKCEFLESQIAMQEKTRQQMQSENIRLTEEAHELNASLKASLSTTQDELVQLRARLEQSQEVERTVEPVIERHLKEANEARAKYKRELTLHAADSRLLDVANRKIEALLSQERSENEQCAKLRAEMQTCETRAAQELEEAEIRYRELQCRLQECEDRNERLYDQLRQQASENPDAASYREIIDDLRHEINICRASSNLTQVRDDRYEAELARLRSELLDTRQQSERALDHLQARGISAGAASHLAEVDLEVVRESNSVLRHQKEDLERALIAHATETEVLTEQLEKLGASVTQLIEERDGLLDHRRELEDERNRWKDRCTQLVERAEQMDPEQYKTACLERDKFSELVKLLETELDRYKNELEEIRASSDIMKVELEAGKEKLAEKDKSITDLEMEVDQAKKCSEKIRLEVDELLQKLEEESKRLKREEGIVVQLREIGRKYRTEADKKRLAMLELEQQLESITEKYNVSQTEAQDTVKRLVEIEAELSSRSDSLEELRSRCDCLEKINVDLSKRLALATGVVTRENARKRPLDDDLREDQGESMGKRSRLDESLSEEEEDDESELEDSEEEDEQREDGDQTNTSTSQPKIDGIPVSEICRSPQCEDGPAENTVQHEQPKLDRDGSETSQQLEINNDTIDEVETSEVEKLNVQEETKENEVEECQLQTLIENKEVEELDKGEDEENETKEDEDVEEEKEEVEDGEVMDDQSNDTSFNGELRIQEDDEEPIAQQRAVKPEQMEQDMSISDDQDDDEDDDDEEDDEEDESVVVIETDSSESEKEEEDFQTRLQQNQDKTPSQTSSSSAHDSISGDPAWDQKLIQMVASSIKPNPVAHSTFTGEPATIPRQMATRGRLRRPLRRPNPNE